MRDAEETQLYEEETFAHQLINTQLNVNKEMIIRIQFLASSNRYVTCSKDGTISYWNDQLVYNPN